MSPRPALHAMSELGPEIFRLAIESSPDLTSITDEAGIIVYANPAHRIALGLGPEDLVGTPALDLVHPDDHAAAAMALRDVSDARGAGGAVPVRLRTRSGGWLRVSTDASLLPGKPGFAVFVSRPADDDAGGPIAHEMERLSAMLRAAQETTPDGVLLVTPEGGTISYNQNYLDIWGMTAADAEAGLARRIELIAAQSKTPDELRRLIEGVYLNPFESVQLELELVDGRVVDMHTAPFMSGGEAHGRVWFFRDVTERVFAQRRVAESEERYRRLVELSPNAIAVHAGGVVRYVNAAALILLNATAEAVLDRNVFDFVHPEDRAKVMQAAMERDFSAPRFVEARVIRPDGEVVLVEIGSSGTTLNGAAATQTVMRDVTARVKAERALRESEESYRALVESAPDAIYVHNGKTISYANQAAAALLGFSSAAELLGRDPWDVLGGNDREEFERRIVRVMAGETYRVAERRLLTYTGQTADVEIALAPATLAGSPAVQVIMRDVSERHRAEEDRLALERKLLETQKLESLGLLAGGIAHDFNNLLVAIMGNAGLALLEADPNSGMSAYLHEIELASQRAADLARQMLAYSGKGKFVVELANVNTLVRELGNLLAVSLPKNATLNFQLAPDVPGVQADVTQLRQIVMNLVINAAEALTEAVGVITIQTGIRELGESDLAGMRASNATPGTFVHLRVQDTGAGMDAATVARIFDPFFTTKFTGRGLGLAAVLGIVRGHNGAIDVHSAPETGTTFDLYLPAAGDRKTLEFPSAEPERRTDFCGWALLVDDEEPVRKVTASMLTRLGFDVLEAADGDQAWTRFAPSIDQLSLVVTDMTMPGMDGCELLGAIRGTGSAVPAVIMSGYSSNSARHCVEQRQVAFLQKPFTLAELREAVSAAAVTETAAAP